MNRRPREYQASMLPIELPCLGKMKVIYLNFSKALTELFLNNYILPSAQGMIHYYESLLSAMLSCIQMAGLSSMSQLIQYIIFDTRYSEYIKRWCWQKLLLFVTINIFSKKRLSQQSLQLGLHSAMRIEPNSCGYIVGCQGASQLGGSLLGIPPGYKANKL